MLVLILGRGFRMISVYNAIDAAGGRQEQHGKHGEDEPQLLVGQEAVESDIRHRRGGVVNDRSTVPSEPRGEGGRGNCYVGGQSKSRPCAQDEGGEEVQGPRKRAGGVPVPGRDAPLGALVEGGVEEEDRALGPDPATPQEAVDEKSGGERQQTAHHSRVDTPEEGHLEPSRRR